MTESLGQNVDVLRPMALLLGAEPANEFASLRKELKNEINPEGVIEQMYVDEFATHIWEIRGLRRYKMSILSSSRLAALQGILQQLLDHRDFEYAKDHRQAVEELARGWFEKKKAKTQVAALLRRFQMDEDAIEAEAFRLSFEDLERLDRMLALAELRRDKTLRCVADYRKILSKQLQRTADQIINNDEVPRLGAVGERSD
jgi:hypothetical protein